MENYLYHGIKWYDYKLLTKLLESGYIMPRCMLEKGLVVDQNNIFNGTKYISLCQKSLWSEGDRYDYRCSFNDYIYGRPALVLKNENIKISYPYLLTMLDKDMMSPEEWHQKIFNDDEQRYSYYSDELQTDEKISLKDNLIAVALPDSHLRKMLSLEESKKILTDIKKALKESELDVPIINSSVYDFADDEEHIKKNILKLH